MVRYCRLLSVFKAFSCKIRDPHLFNRSGIKVTEGFSVICNIAATTCIAINYSRMDFFSSESLKRNKMLSLHLDLKSTLNLQYGKFPSIVRLSLVLKSSEALPKYSKAQINSLLGIMKLRSLWIYSLFKKNLIKWARDYGDMYWVIMLTSKFQFPDESSHKWSIIWNFCEVKLQLTHVITYLV